MRRNGSMMKLAVAAALIVLAPSLLTLAQQKGSLHDRAKQSGGKLVEKFKADRSSAYPNLEELAKRSTAIIIGHAIANRAHLTTDGNSVTTDFSILVQEVVKGNLRPGSVAVVSLPGGGHRFDDGVTAFLYAANYKRAQNGKAYAFFLDKKGAVSRGWQLTGGIQGQFELDSDSGKVTPAGTAGHDPLVDRYRNKPIKDFLVELHKAVGNPKRSK